MLKFFAMLLLAGLQIMPAQVVAAEGSAAAVKKAAASSQVPGRVITDPLKINEALLALHNLNYLTVRPDEPVEKDELAWALLALQAYEEKGLFSNSGEMKAITQEIYDFLKPYVTQPEGWRWIALKVDEKHGGILFAAAADSRIEAEDSLQRFCIKTLGQKRFNECALPMVTIYSTPERDGWVAVQKCESDGVTVYDTHAGFSVREVVAGSGTYENCQVKLVINADGKQPETATKKKR